MEFETDRNESIYKRLYTYFKEHRLQHRGITRNSWNPPAFALKAFRPAALLYYNYSAMPFTHHHLFEQLISVESSSPLELVPRLDAFPFFVAQMGPQIFVLWKAALLKKRILFMTRPPLQRACGYGKINFILFFILAYIYVVCYVYVRLIYWVKLSLNYIKNGGLHFILFFPCF